MTYDTPDMQQPFLDVASITYPILSDIDGSSAIALGILNEQYVPGEEAYGIPHPGIYVLTPDREIVKKYFVEGYDIRVDGEVVLSEAIEALAAQ